MVNTKVSISESSVDEACYFTLPSPLADATVYSQHKEMPPNIKTALAVHNGEIAVIKKSRADLNSVANAIEAKNELLNVLFKPYGVTFNPTIEGE